MSTFEHLFKSLFWKCSLPKWF